MYTLFWWQLYFFSLGEMKIDFLKSGQLVIYTESAHVGLVFPDETIVYRIFGTVGVSYYQGISWLAMKKFTIIESLSDVDFLWQSNDILITRLYSLDIDELSLTTQIFYFVIKSKLFLYFLYLI